MASKKSISPTRQRKLQFLQASPENSVAESDIPIITCSLYDLISQSVKKSVRENSFIESYLTDFQKILAARGSSPGVSDYWLI
jgi:hypothetical protein